MNVKNVFRMEGRLWLRLRETGGKKLEVPCHHNLKSYLTAYVAEAGIHGDREGPLFRSLERNGSLSERRFNRHSAWEMLARRARTAGITTPVCNHSFRATSITAYPENPEARVKVAQYLADHAKTETTKLYDRRVERVSLDEILRLGMCATRRSPLPHSGAVLPPIIENIYNATRLNLALGYLSPNSFEEINALDG